MQDAAVWDNTLLNPLILFGEGFTAKMKLSGEQTKMEKQDLSEKVLKIMRQLGNMPMLDTRTYTSKDGKYVINEVRIKTIKPVNYYEAIIRNRGTQFPYGQNKKEGDDNDRSY